MFLDLGAHTYTDVLSTWGGSQKIEEQISTNVLQRVMFAMGAGENSNVSSGVKEEVGAALSCSGKAWGGAV